jgi:diguanylate cyclase (GGDEF)-like protein
MKEELSRAQRTGHGLACLIIDVDLFKQINDQHGHHSGDIALREVAQRVDAQIRGSDAAARFGGDEFVVLVPDSDVEHARMLAERIRKAVCESPLQLSPGVQVNLTVSIGVAAILPTRDSVDLQKTAEALMAQSDVALYQAKQLGRNRVEVAQGAG